MQVSAEGVGSANAWRPEQDSGGSPTSELLERPLAATSQTPVSRYRLLGSVNLRPRDVDDIGVLLESVDKVEQCLTLRPMGDGRHRVDDMSQLTRTIASSRHKGTATRGSSGSMNAF